MRSNPDETHVMNVRTNEKFDDIYNRKLIKYQQYEEDQKRKAMEEQKAIDALRNSYLYKNLGIE